MSSLRALFFPLGLSTFCPSPISVTSISLTPFSPLGLHPTPPPLCPLHQTTLLSRCIVCLWTVIPVTFSISPLCLSLLRDAQPLGWICNCESERALRWILNPKPRQFLPRQNLFISESPPSLVPQAAFAHLTSSLAAVWLCWQQLPDDERVAITFCNVLFPPVQP